MAEKRLKIAFLNISQGAVHRGGETLVQNLANELSGNHDVEVLKGNIVPPRRWPFLWRFFIDPHGLATLWFTLKLIPELFQQRFDIVIPINGGWQPLIVRLITKMQGTKMLITAQSGVGWDDRVNLLCFPDVCILPSSRALEWARTVNARVSSWYIPNGVDLSRFSPSGEKFKTKLKRPIIVCVAALVTQKRIDLVIKAVAKIKSASLLIVGKGEEKRTLHTLAQKLLEGRCEFVNLSHDDMPQVYRSGDLFTLVSTPTEAFGLVFVEALSCNLPVVAIDDGQRREIMEDAGQYVVNPQDSGKYAEVIQKALNKKWGDIPRRRAEKFSWKSVSDEYEKVIKRIVK